MSDNTYPTAKEKLNSGEWKHIYTGTKGILGIHYYCSQSVKTKMYQVYYINCASAIGVPALYLLSAGLKILSKFLDLISKELGNELREITLEAKELIRARKHLDSTGNAYNLSKSFSNINECKEASENDFRDKLNKINKRKKGK